MDEDYTWEGFKDCTLSNTDIVAIGEKIEAYQMKNSLQLVIFRKKSN